MWALAVLPARAACAASPSLLEAVAECASLRWTGCDMAAWNVSGAADLGGLFAFQPLFEADIADWDVSAARTLAGLFERAGNLRCDPSRWNVSGVRDFSRVFSGAASFNGEVAAWDVAGGRDFRGMFAGATAFRGDLRAWNLSGLPAAATAGMFHGARPCGCPLGLPAGACNPSAPHECREPCPPARFVRRRWYAGALSVLGGRLPVLWHAQAHTLRAAALERRSRAHLIEVPRRRSRRFNAITARAYFGARAALAVVLWRLCRCWGGGATGLFRRGWARPRAAGGGWPKGRCSWWSLWSRLG